MALTDGFDLPRSSRLLKKDLTTHQTQTDPPNLRQAKILCAQSSMLN
jgi:hypothetical protein